MSRIIDVIQGSEQWLNIRLGIPTASQFFRIITPAYKPSSAVNLYLLELLAERAIGESVKSYNSPAMERGSEKEMEARAWYEYKYEVDIQQVGFVTSNDGRYGCSPDGLIGSDGLIEIKCPLADKHVGYMLDSPVDDYRIQIQGQLFVCEREWCDLLSYNPVMPEAVVRLVQDEAFVDAFEPLLSKFLNRLDEMWLKLVDMGVKDMAAAAREADEQAAKEFSEIFPDMETLQDRFKE